MRVALELQPCGGQMTGIGHYTYELVRRLVPSETFQLQGNMFNFAGRHNNRALYNAVPFPVVEDKLMPYGVYRRLWQFMPVGYEFFFGPADVTHFFNYIVPPRIKGKVITTVHDVTYLRYPETVNKANLRRIREGIAYSVERSRLIVTSSQFSKREIMELLKVPAERVAVIPAAASISDACMSEVPVTGPYILYVGAIEPRKNLQRLLKAYELLKREAGIPHKLVLAGGRGWKCKDIYRTAESIYGSQDVLFQGHVPEAEKNALYANAAAFVFPSLYEGFGIPPLEAMHWGTPVICSDAASLPEVAGDAACYVDPFSVESIAEGIWRVLSDKAYARQLVEAGRIRCRQFDWDASARKLEQIYCSISEGSI